MISHLKKRKRLISGAFLALAAIVAVLFFAIGHWTAATQLSLDVAMVQVNWHDAGSKEAPSLKEPNKTLEEWVDRKLKKVAEMKKPNTDAKGISISTILCLVLPGSLPPGHVD